MDKSTASSFYYLCALALPYLPLLPFIRNVESSSPNPTPHNLLKFAHCHHLIVASIA